MDFVLARWVNGFAGRSSVADAIGIFLATWLILFLAFAAVMTILRAARSDRRARALELIAVVLIAYAASQIIGMLAFRERPFVRHSEIRQLVAKEATSKSFPSDHATLAFVLATPMLWSAVVSRRWRAAALVASFAVAFGRVYVGVHYPSDVVVGALLALMVGWAVHRVARARETKTTAGSVG